jgi:hypothetical protein
MSLTWRKWIPAGVAVVVVAGAAVAVPVAANASVSLPSKTPAQVLELLESSKVTAFSGDIAETSDLGLPTLSASSVPGGGSVGGSGSLASELALLTGNNSLRVYVDGVKNLRVQDLGSMSESDVIRHNSDVWIYNSKTNSAEHTTISAADRSTSATPGEHSSQEGALPQGTVPGDSSNIPKTPQGVADALLATLAPTSDVAISDNVRVAGRAAYTLVVTPKVSDTLIGSVSVAVDAATGLPLQVQIDARGQKDPAVSIEFTSLTLSKPDASLFAAPGGVKIKELKKKSDPKPEATHSTPEKPTEVVTGKGWDAVVTLTAASSEGKSISKLTSSAEFSELTQKVADGSVFHTTLFNVLLTTDGRVIAGAVSVDRLEAVAAQ